MKKRRYLGSSIDFYASSIPEELYQEMLNDRYENHMNEVEESFIPKLPKKLDNVFYDYELDAKETYLLFYDTLMKRIRSINFVFTMISLIFFLLTFLSMLFFWVSDFFVSVKTLYFNLSLIMFGFSLMFYLITHRVYSENYAKKRCFKKYRYYFYSLKKRVYQEIKEHKKQNTRTKSNS